jgi:hypothetical protein
MVRNHNSKDTEEAWTCKYTPLEGKKQQLPRHKQDLHLEGQRKRIKGQCGTA